MKQLEAMAKTLQIWEERIDWQEGVVWFAPDLPPELGLEHCQGMLKRVTSDFSEAKLGRWLGWLQAAAVANGVLTLEECKNINTSFA